MCVCVGLGFRDRAPRDPRKVLIETKMALDDEGLKSPLSVISVSQETTKKKHAAGCAGYLTSGKALAHFEPSVHSEVTDIIV